MTKVFIDGSSGTTGLRIFDRLSLRRDIELVRLPEELRHDENARCLALNGCDIAFLCLPDDAARDAVNMIDDPDVVVLDTSTAHRTAPGWAYGFPELSKERFEAVRTSKRIAVPGCHASGFIALVAPLVAAGAVAPYTRLTGFSLTGYSGGGKKMIAQYEDGVRDPLLGAPRQYGLGQTHKHLREMTAVSGIGLEPAFCPVVADYYSGMEFTVTLFSEDLCPGFDGQSVRDIYRAAYDTPVVRCAEGGDEGGFLSAAALAGSDRMEISVFGNEERLLLTARYDNLGKGASGAAVECMNIVMGLDPTTGLEL